MKVSTFLILFTFLLGHLSVFSNCETTKTKPVTSNSTICLSSPCKNNGECQPFGSNNYTCKCASPFQGSRCKYKRLNSTLFPNSTILTNEDSLELVKLIKFPSNQSWIQFYQSSSSNDRFNSSDFLDRCKNIRNILLILKIKNSSNIFGGFTTFKWDPFNFDLNDTKAFLFSLKNSHNIPVVMNVTKPKNSIEILPYGGISWGLDDLSIRLRFFDNNVKSYDGWGFSKLGGAYQLPNFINSNESETFLAGNKTFKVIEMEAYAFKQCWNSPCLNGAECTENGTNFKCNCKNGYYGNLCQTKRLNSTIFVNSTILTQELSLNLLNITGFRNKSFSLLYQATKDSFSSESFHSKCDSHNGTLTVIKSKSGNIFGGYTEADWSGFDEYKYDSKAFLFSLSNKHQKSIKISIKNPKFAILASKFSGPVFGYADFGNPIHISNNADIYPFSKTWFYNGSYEAPEFELDSYNFAVEEIEVYLVKCI